MERVLKIGLVGAGMFGGDVHARAYAALQVSGIAPHLARLGLDHWAREFAPLKFQLAAVATRTQTSARAFQQRFKGWTGTEPRAFWGEKPWVSLLSEIADLDLLAVATPDPLHTPVILAGLNANAHVLTEKPMCLEIQEADEIIETARVRRRIVALDMHKRYDPDHLRIRRQIATEIGEPLYGIAYLEEPLEVSASTFKWATQSDPFSYVGSHWVDLLYHYYRVKPVSLTAIGQKRLLLRRGIDAYDAVQVRVDYENGMSIVFHNNWITPAGFEGPVNQGHEIVGTRGKVESDQQYRGLRWWTAEGTRSGNTHFTRLMQRPDGSETSVGYGIDSLMAGVAAVCRVKWFGATPEEVASIYPTAEEGRITTAILHAARVVRDLNFNYLRAGKGGASVSARFGQEGILILDPNRASDGDAGVCQRIYSRPV